MWLFEILSVLQGKEVKFTWPYGKDQVFGLLPGDLIFLHRGMDLMSSCKEPVPTDSVYFELYL